MLEPPEQLQLPQKLKDVILSKKCVAFIGSGLSAGCYPSWAKLVNDLCEKCDSSHHVNDDSLPEEFLDAAQDAKNQAKDKYFSFLGETFGRPARNASLTYDALLALPFDSYLTVNLDPLLALKARTARLRCSGDVKAFPSLDRKEMGNGTVHYLHGLIQEGTTPADGTIVLARGEFDDAYNDNSNLMNFLVPTFENDPIVFIGCRLREPVMPKVFNICKQHQLNRQGILQRENRLSEPPPCFIFLPIPEVKNERGELDEAQSQEQQQQKERYYLDMDIRPVWYRASGSDHSQLRYALERLADLKPPIVSHAWQGGCDAQ